MFNINKIKQLIALLGALCIGLPVMAAAPIAGARITMINGTGGRMNIFRLEDGSDLFSSYKDIPEGEQIIIPRQPNALKVYTNILKPGGGVTFKLLDIPYVILDVRSLPAGDLTFRFKLAPTRDKIEYTVSAIERKEAKEGAAAAAARPAAFRVPAAVSLEDRLRETEARLRECQEELARVRAGGVAAGGIREIIFEPSAGEIVPAGEPKG